jgi:alkanesulfonate monooxygenase SsuD/methylene tetrahydromethanopterin reductase-like flavin-dependent oxidoreductase (luciferase family)
VTTETADFLLDGHLEGEPLPPGRVSFEMTGRGPRMLAAAAALADSVLVVGAGFEEGARTIATIREAARAAGRAEPPAITWSTYAVPDDALLDDLAPYMAYGLAEPTTIDRGVDAATVAAIRETLHREGRVAAGRLVPREYISSRVPVGTAAECRARLTTWADDQQIETVLLRIPDSTSRDRWLAAACAIAASSPAPSGMGSAPPPSPSGRGLG